MPKISQLIYSKTRSWITVLCYVFILFICFWVETGNGVYNFLVTRVEPGQCGTMSHFEKFQSTHSRRSENKTELTGNRPRTLEWRKRYLWSYTNNPQTKCSYLRSTFLSKACSPFTGILEIKNSHVEMWLFFFELSLFSVFFFLMFFIWHFGKFLLRSWDCLFHAKNTQGSFYPLGSERWGSKEP